MAKKKTQNSLPVPAPIAPRDAQGRFPVGVSGNPAGRPVGKKNEITEISQELELAIRKGIKESDITDIVTQLVVAAKGGSIQAARLLLDKVLPNARTGDDADANIRSLIIKIENTTFGAEAAPRDVIDVQVIPSCAIGNDTTRQTT